MGQRELGRYVLEGMSILLCMLFETLTLPLLG